jgi:hypothetical protein
VRNVPDETEEIKTHILCSRTPSQIRAVYGIMWKHMIEPGWSPMTIWRTRITCSIIKATDTLRIYNTHCFSTATMVARRCPNVTSTSTLVNNNATNNSWINHCCCSTWLRIANYAKGTFFWEHQKSEIQYTESTFPCIYKNTKCRLELKLFNNPKAFSDVVNHITKSICGWEMWIN